MRTRHPARLKAFDYLGFHRYFLTFCVEYRQHAFEDASAVELVYAQILRAAQQERFAILAYCFMPDHVHLLVEGESPNADGGQFIRLSKQFSGFEYKKAFRRRLWQRYGYERVLRSNEATLSVARYIIENPLRAKLAERVDDYPYLGSSLFTLEQILEAVQWTPGDTKGDLEWSA